MFEDVNYFYIKAASGIKDEWLNLDSSDWYDYIFNLPEKGKLCYMVMILHNQVCNGGLDQYFTNGYGQFAKETIHHLKQIHAFSEAELLVQALDAVKPKSINFPEFRRKLLSKTLNPLFCSDDLSNFLNDLDSKYYSLGDSAIEKLDLYLKR